MRRPSRRAVLGAALGVGLGTGSGCLGTTGDPSTGVEPASLGTEQALASTTVETEADAESRTERDSSGTDSPRSTAE